jgi:hypothetical protein
MYLYIYVYVHVQPQTIHKAAPRLNRNFENILEHYFIEEEFLSK